MRVLVDTHTFLWMVEGNPRLSPRALAAVSDPEVEVLVSAASAYEIVFKHVLGKLPNAAVLAANFLAGVVAADCVPLPITIAHADAAAKLDLSHRDPFDRLLIAQALIEGVPLVSNDEAVDRFGVERIW